MHKVGYGIAMASLCLAVMLTLPFDSKAGEPVCARCHASVSESHHLERQAEASKNEAYTTKHYKVQEKGGWGLRPVEPVQHPQFLEQAIKIGGKEM